MNKLCTVSSFINTNFQFSARLSGWQPRLETGSSPSRTLNPLSTVQVLIDNLIAPHGSLEYFGIDKICKGRETETANWPCTFSRCIHGQRGRRVDQINPSVLKLYFLYTNGEQIRSFCKFFYFFQKKCEAKQIKVFTCSPVYYQKFIPNELEIINTWNLQIR